MCPSCQRPDARRHGIGQHRFTAQDQQLARHTWITRSGSRQRRLSVTPHAVVGTTGGQPGGSHPTRPRSAPTRTREQLGHRRCRRCADPAPHVCGQVRAGRSTTQVDQAPHSLHSRSIQPAECGSHADALARVGATCCSSHAFRRGVQSGANVLATDERQRRPRGHPTASRGPSWGAGGAAASALSRIGARVGRLPRKLRGMSARSGKRLGKPVDERSGVLPARSTAGSTVGRNLPTDPATVRHPLIWHRPRTATATTAVTVTRDRTAGPVPGQGFGRGRHGR